MLKEKNLAVRCIVQSILVLIAFLICCSNTLTDAVIDKYRDENSVTRNRENWSFEIQNKYRFGRDNLDNNYRFLLKWLFNPEDYDNNLKNNKLRASFLEKAFNQNLIITQAIEDGILRDGEFEHYLWITIKDAIVQFYLKKRISAEKSQFYKVPVTNSDIETHYKKFGELYESMGLDKEDAYEYIKNAISREYISKRVEHYEKKVLNELKLKNQIRFAK